LSKANLELQGENDKLQEDHTSFLKRNPEVIELIWVRENILDDKSKIARVVIHRKGDTQFENYHLDNEKEMAAFEKKYGKLPSVPPVEVVEGANADNAYTAFYARNPEVKELAWRSNNKLVIKLKSGAEENYTFGDKKGMAAAEARYGKLPSAPPVVIRDTEQTSGQGTQGPDELIQELKRNRAIKSVRTRKIDGKDAIVIGLKGGGTEVYFIGDAASLAELKRKYVMPELPPPPPPAPAPPVAPPAPPVPAKEQLPPPPPPVQEVDIPAPPAPPVKPDASNMLLNFPDGVVYYLDGKEDKTEAYKKLDPKKIHSINVIKGEHAQKIAGSKAVKGIVSIVTEKNKNSREVKAFEQKLNALPAPPPPVRQEGPAIPKAGGARLVETEEFVTYILWPEEITVRELEVAEQAFKDNNFRLKSKLLDGGSTVNITLSSGKLNKGTSQTYLVQDLLKTDNIVLVQGNKKTGEIRIATTLAPR